MLVVDDEASICALIVDLAEERGHSALTACNGVAALTLAREHPPALIISDVMMPVMDGYALLQALRADPILAHTALYLMSAASLRPLQPQEARPNGYMPKPFALATIEGLLDGIPLAVNAQGGESVSRL